MSAHSELGPSSSERWLNCSPSAKLNAEFPEESSSFAEEGTEAHALCEYKVKKALGLPAEDPRDGFKYLNEEMEECSDDYRDFVLEVLEQAKLTCPDPIVLIEQHIEYERFVHGGFGTADCLIIADKTMYVIDFKYGLGVLVSALGNPQMRIYALGAMEAFGNLYDIQDIKMTIFQPRKNNVSEDEIKAEALYEWAEQVLKPAAKKAETGDGPFKCGDWCRFCKAKHRCRERAKVNLELAAFDFASPALLSDEEIVGILGKVDRLASWAEDIKEYALQEAINGKKWDGFKLVEGRSIRKYVNEEKVIEIVEKAGFDPFIQKLLTISDMEKLLGKKKFSEILGNWVTKPTGKPLLVEEGDKRPELNMAKTDFKE